MKIRSLVVTGYGINADVELAEALGLAGSMPERVHVSDLIREPEILERYRIAAFPGGFSFGDHLGSGMVLANLCRERVLGPLVRLVESGGLVIGICNGFQVLVKLGVLPNLAGTFDREASLVHNDREGYLDAWVGVRFEDSLCAWTRGLEPGLLPIRHGEGRFIARDDATLAALEAGRRVALRYAEPNPNGSANAIAGICDATGRVLGLMPHPEAYLCRENHPLRRRGLVGKTGVELFERGVAEAERNA